MYSQNKEAQPFSNVEGIPHPFGIRNDKKEMELSIDTSLNNEIKIAIIKDGVVLFEDCFEARYRQAERLLPAIRVLLSKGNINIKSIKKIKVKEEGEGFSSLRIGVVTANALAFALGIPVESTNEINKVSSGDFNIILPKYNKEPSIG